MSYKNVFRIKNKQQFLMLSSFLLYNFFLIFLAIFLHAKIEVLVFMFILLFLIDGLPTLIIHRNYLLNDKGTELTIDIEFKEIIYKKQTINRKYNFSDIIRLEFCCSTVMNNGIHSFGQYRYCKFFFKDSSDIVVTCLMIEDIKNTLENLLKVRSEMQKKLLCIIE
jgi:hypothetical protein